MRNMKFARDSRPVWAAAATALALTVLFGNGWFVTWLTAAVGELAIPGAIGLPGAVPGLRLWPLGETDWWHTASETIAAAGFIAIVWWRMARAHTPDGISRPFLTGWSTAVVALVCADVWRVVAQSFTQDLGLGGYFGYLVAAVIYGTVWAIATGWLIGLAAMIAARTATETPPPTDEPGDPESEEPTDTTTAPRAGVTDSPP
ncbi:hypothetical protein FB566_3754 [Stackebrandtia endophytica]|uniref:Uncharacterized protein n=2 Tax=Stackebrandtia endophytica TaxID=1496996 RepID=A0A543B054_9ACTN|nr:hypothetical protein FB566_3754 [Stackebrandtia endophytica]